jgi:tRNA pseudouridine38-40 synthase
VRTILARVAYDGTDFAGYQSQKRERTVQSVLEKALAELHGHPVPTVVAGRTDAGVHATGQYVSFVSDHDGIPVDQFGAAIMSRLPRDVTILATRVVPEGFHARFDAKSRHYRYHIALARVLPPHRRLYVWRVPDPLEVDRINRDAAALVGEHDFTTFASRRADQRTMVRRVLYADMTRRGDELEFAIGANGFLWRMVRSLVGTLVARERLRLRGEEPPLSMARLLEARDRSLAGTTAPATGLFLHDVEYEW